MAKIKKNTKIKEGSQRKKLKRPLAAEEQLVCETEPKKKKQSLKRNIPCSSGTTSESRTKTEKGHEVNLAMKAVEEEKELSAEERRILERKLKKERKKEEKKLMREAGISAKKEETKKPSGSELALEYLTSWSENPKDWKFQKTRQTWLLLHMYDKEKVPDTYFSILLEYLEGLKGSAREVTVQKAEALMKEYDSADLEDPDLLDKCERIRQVLQLLS
uniref:Chromosome 7 open reading frame 50 n=2 Tax=Crocodylus porosus TaxID=8502 RepID=A0A7M4G227_CROPO